ncbi:hypothetical protein CQW23_21310 [Capsicum baccatum]|uniref:Uncharacterized protein n=1 Tax=Capsicum baccatum TaxID=33114 RepID=A0A2G2VXM8_CAPBA|nr:hypothetical protein CQW23_21310 [Capsicum baccatum]
MDASNSKTGHHTMRSHHVLSTDASNCKIGHSDMSSHRVLRCIHSTNASSCITEYSVMSSHIVLRVTPISSDRMSVRSSARRSSWLFAWSFFWGLDMEVLTGQENGRARILDIASVDAEDTGTSQAVPNTNNESMLPQESTNTEQIIAVAGGVVQGIILW